MGKAKLNPPAVPYFKPIDINATIAQALNYDTEGFNFSDQDFASRFPGLVSARNQQVQDAYSQLTGPLDPTVENQFATNALGAGIGTVGGGDPLSALGMTQGSFGSNVATATLGNELLDKQSKDRSYFETLIGNNPQRAFGISGSDVANLGIANTGGLNASNQQQYSSTLAGIYGQGQQGVATGQQIAAIGNLLGRINWGGNSNAGTGVGARG